jgi:hypothetical protein
MIMESTLATIHGESMSTASKPHQHHYTRKTGAELISKTFGIPFPKSRFDKDAMSIDGREPVAPKPIARYGNVDLYTERQILAYGASLIRTVETEENEAA